MIINSITSRINQETFTPEITISLTISLELIHGLTFYGEAGYTVLGKELVDRIVEFGQPEISK